jgi:hypothetical protein
VRVFWRHQIMVLDRQLGSRTVRLTPVDRAFLAALLRQLPPKTLCRLVDGRGAALAPGPDRTPPCCRVRPKRPEKPEYALFTISCATVISQKQIDPSGRIFGWRVRVR